MNLMGKIARQENNVYRAWCPALPGCMVYGQSEREAKSRIAQAVRGYLDHLDRTLPRELSRRRVVSRSGRFAGAV